MDEGWMRDRWMDEGRRRMDEGWMDGWTDEGRMRDGWMDRRMRDG